MGQLSSIGDPKWMKSGKEQDHLQLSAGLCTNLLQHKMSKIKYKNQYKLEREKYAVKFLNIQFLLCFYSLLYKKFEICKEVGFFPHREGNISRLVNLPKFHHDYE